MHYTRSTDYTTASNYSESAPVKTTLLKVSFSLNAFQFSNYHSRGSSCCPKSSSYNTLPRALRDSHNIVRVKDQIAATEDDFQHDHVHFHQASPQLAEMIRDILIGPISEQDDEESYGFKEYTVGEFSQAWIVDQVFRYYLKSLYRYTIFSG